jgi:hypothetical protein
MSGLVTTTFEEYESLCKISEKYNILIAKYTKLQAQYTQLQTSWTLFHDAYAQLKMNYNALIGTGDLGEVD